MSHAIYFVVSSSTKDQGEIVVVDMDFLRDNYDTPGPWNDDETGGEHSMSPGFLPAVAREPRLAISTPEAMRITAALNVDGRAPRGVVLDSPYEAQAAIMDATGVDNFYPEARTVLVLAPMDDAMNEVGYQGYGALQSEIEMAGDEIKEEAQELEDDGRSPEEAEAETIFRRYKLYGTEPEGFDGLLDLFSPEPVDVDALLDWMVAPEPHAEAKAEAVAEAAAVAPRVPYEKFSGEGGAPGECLVQGLIVRYSRLAKGKAIVENSIRRYFGEENGGPSLERLHEFCKKYKIPLRVYTVLGAEITALRHQTPPNERNARRGLVVMAYNHHAYFYTGGGLGTKIDLTTTSEHDVEAWHTSSGRLFKGKGKKRVALDEDEEGIVFEFLKLSRQQNMSYRCEMGVGARSLTWACLEPEHRCGALDCCGRVAYDMNSAFHSCATLKDWTALGLDKERARAASRIPIFCVHDDYTVNAGAVAFPLVEDWAITYFYVSQECLERWKGGGGHLSGRCSNLLVGLEFAYLESTGAVRRGDVVGWKTATYALRAEKLAEKIRHLDEHTEAVDGMARGVFSLMNGLLGRVVSRAGFVSSRLGADDAELVQAGRENDERVTVDDKQVKDGETTVRVKIEKGTREYRTINTRTIYDHVVAKTNLAMMLFVDQTRGFEENKEARILKLSTDCACFDRPVRVPDWAGLFFKRELPRHKPRFKSVKYHDPAVLRECVRTEIQAFVAGHCRTYVGSPGTGKTYGVMEGKEANEAMAFSNVLARSLDHGDVVGQTIHRALRLYEPNLLSKVIGRLRGRTLWLDEISTVQAHVWSVIYCVGLKLKLLILTGDMHQTPPVGEGSRERSIFFQELLGSAKELTVDHRNDSGLIRLREFIKREEDPTRLVAGVEAEIRGNPRLDASQMLAKDLAAIDVHLTAFRRTRAAINRIVLRERGLKFQFVEQDEKIPAGYMISKGVRLAARETRAAVGIYNGAIYELLTAAVPTRKRVKIRRIYNNGKAPGEEFEVEAKYLGCFEPGYAMTTHSCIGTTVSGQTLAVHEIGKMVRWDKRIAYTAITRGCRLEDLRLCMLVPPCVRDELGRADKNPAPEPPPPDEGDEDAEDPEELQERLDRARELAKARAKREWREPIQLEYARRDAPGFGREYTAPQNNAGAGVRRRAGEPGPSVPG